MSIFNSSFTASSTVLQHRKGGSLACSLALIHSLAAASAVMFVAAIKESKLAS